MDALIVRVIEARNVAPMDKGGTSDPYCKVRTSFNKQTFKTKVIDKTLNPYWGEEFKFFHDRPDGVLLLKMWDRDRFSKDDFLGQVEINLTRYPPGAATHDLWLELANEPKKKSPEPGTVHVQLVYQIRGQTPSPAAGANGASAELADAGAGASADAGSAGSAQPASAQQHAGVLEDHYEVLDVLGRGGFSIVRKGRSKHTGQFYAIKCIDKVTAKADELQLLGREIEIMKRLKHQNIVHLEEIFETKQSLYLVMELVTGGELFDKIVERGSYSEHDAVTIVKQILEAVAYMHVSGVAHRDLKPENLLCSGPNGEVIKLADFGLSKDFDAGSLQTSCGTPSYVAPEVLQGEPYDCEVDIWSVGVITYVLLCGFTPFYGDTQREMFEKILSADFDFPSPEWDDVTRTAKDFIKSMLVANPTKRPSAEQCLRHPWIVGKETAPRRTLSSMPSIREKIQHAR